MIKLSILDQSPVSEGMTHAQALQKTAELAIEAERLGYHRFWVSEHHSAANLAGSSPEVLISHLAARTSTIRVGSGGVMLPHYSAYKVAENFRVLEGCIRDALMWVWDERLEECPLLPEHCKKAKCGVVLICTLSSWMTC